MISAAISIHANTGRRIDKSASDAMADPRRETMALCVSERSMISNLFPRHSRLQKVAGVGSTPGSEDIGFAKVLESFAWPSIYRSAK
jgi:hypothetical protein